MQKTVLIIIIIILLTGTCYAHGLDTKKITDYLDEESGLESETESAVGEGIGIYVLFIRSLGIIFSVFNLIHVAVIFMSGNPDKIENGKRKVLYIILGLFVTLQAEILTRTLLSLFSGF